MRSFRPYDLAGGNNGKTPTDWVDDTDACQNSGSLRDAKVVVADRLSEAGLHTTRFIRVEEGRKQSYDHAKHGPDDLTGNYGVYAGDDLVGVDIDDYRDDVDTSAIDHLPATFSVKTPHDGTHLYFRGVSGTKAAIEAATGGARNASLSWGEIYVDGKYLVGPGSRITDCDKRGCTECRRSGGSYEISEDRPIAEITPEQILAVLAADSDGSSGIPQTALTMYEGRRKEPNSASTTLAQDLSRPDSKIREVKDPKRKLWLSLLRHHQHNGVKTGVRIVRLIDRAEELGLNRSRAADHLMRWIESGRIRRSEASNRVVPAWVAQSGPEDQTKGEQTSLDSFV